MKVPQINYFELDHEATNKKFLGGLTFMNTISIYGVATAVYKAKTPDKKKGHKKYMLLFLAHETMYVSGMTSLEIKKYRYAEGIHCLQCDEFLVSVSRHDYKACSCPNEATIDGGDCYIRSGAMDLTKIKLVRVDMFTRKVV